MSRPRPAAPPADSSSKFDYRNPATDAPIPVEADKRKSVTDDLQATVAEPLELFHDSKQSHWNLRGPLHLLHGKRQENTGDYHKYVDILAERVLQVGNSHRRAHRGSGGNRQSGPVSGWLPFQ